MMQQLIKLKTDSQIFGRVTDLLGPNSMVCKLAQRRISCPSYRQITDPTNR